MKKFMQITCLLLFICVLSGCGSSEPTTTCGDCGAKFPEKYAIRDFFGDTVCPECAQFQIDMYANQQEEMMDSVYDSGSYISDSEDYMVLEKAECNWCGNYAPADLYDQNGERICIDCITEALQDDNVARAIQNYIEYG